MRLPILRGSQSWSFAVARRQALSDLAMTRGSVWDRSGEREAIAICERGPQARRLAARQPRREWHRALIQLAHALLHVSGWTR
jgi:hypothetical protein